MSQRLGAGLSSTRFQRLAAAALIPRNNTRRIAVSSNFPAKAEGHHPYPLT
jgi:hypothetical protein